MKYLAQNKIARALTALVALVALSGCASIAGKGDSVNVNLAGAGLIQPSINQAVLAVQAAKAGEINSLPFIVTDTRTLLNIDPPSELEAYVYKPTTLLGSRVDKNGVHTLSLLTSFRDGYGRIDRRAEKIVYSTSSANAEQADDVKAWLIQQNRSTQKSGQGLSRQAVVDFQEAKGVSADGQFGPNSANALVEDVLMLEVERIDSHIFYPSTPNHMVFLMPYESFEKNTKKLSTGFKSWYEVSTLSLTSQVFKSRARKGDKYVLFVYFFDRVDPNYGISINFSDAEQKWAGKQADQIYQPDDTGWMVIAKTFTVDDGVLPDSLFVNICQEKSVLDRPCVASHKLL